jgi:hypothetical protein
MHVNSTAIDKDINKRSVVENYGVRGKLQNHENFTTSTVTHRRFCTSACFLKCSKAPGTL